MTKRICRLKTFRKFCTGMDRAEIISFSFSNSASLVSDFHHIVGPRKCAQKGCSPRGAPRFDGKPYRRRAGRFVQSGRTTFFPVPSLLTFTTGRTVTFLKRKFLITTKFKSGRAQDPSPLPLGGALRRAMLRSPGLSSAARSHSRLPTQSLARCPAAARSVPVPPRPA